jgi:RNA polymerase primary sigma factor
MRCRTAAPQRTVTSSLDSYLESISRYELLSREEEAVLAARARSGDAQALDALVCANLRFVVSIARKYQHFGVSLADLISEGNVGLLRAARRFDERKGFKLVSYAVWWIRQSILQALSEQGRAVRVPVGQSGALMRVSRRSNSLAQSLCREPTMEEVAKELGVPAAEVAWTLTVLRSATSLDAAVGGDDDLALAEVLGDERAPAPDAALGSDDIAGTVEKALASLGAREAGVLRSYFGFTGEVLTLEQIGIPMGISRERVRQIRDRALRRLRKQVPDYLEVSRDHRN